MNICPDQQRGPHELAKPANSSGGGANFARWWRVALVVCLAGWGAGCKTVENDSLTYKLWDRGNISFCQPAPHPELAVFNDPAKHDFLVQYNALSDRKIQVTRLAYFVAASEARIEKGQAPHFVKPGKYSNLQTIPNQISTNAYVVVSNDGRSFTLYRPNQLPERHELPFYQDDHWSATRVALTPLAVTGDAVLLGACGGVIAVWVLCESNATFHP